LCVLSALLPHLFNQFPVSLPFSKALLLLFLKLGFQVLVLIHGGIAQV
jgi:hypothetical protein